MRQLVGRIRVVLLRVWLVPVLGGYAMLAAAVLLGNRALAIGGMAAVVGFEWVLGNTQSEDTDLLRVARREVRVGAAALFGAAAVGVVTGGSTVALASYVLGALAIEGGVVLFRHQLRSLIDQEPPFVARNLGTQPSASSVFAGVRQWHARGPILLFSLYLPFAAGVLVGGASDATIGLGIAVAVLVAALVTAIEWWRRRFLAGGVIDGHVENLARGLSGYDPDAVFHVPSGQWVYTVNQWVPVVNASGRRVVFVCRTFEAERELAETPLPVVVARRKRDLEQVLVPECRVALHSSEPRAIKDFFEDTSVRNVRLSHGDSDKSYNAQPLARAYDEIWAAGEAAIDRYEAAGIDIPRDRFRVIGRPQVEAIEVGPLMSSPPTLLYAPTYEGLYEHADYSSVVTGGAAMIEAIIREHPDVGIIFKPHPMTGYIDQRYKAARERINDLLRDAPNPELHVVADDEKAVGLFDYFNRAHVLLADISAVISDFLHSERPIIVTNPKGFPLDDFFSRYPTQRGNYVIAPTPAEVLGALDAALGDDPMADERRKMKTYTLGDLPHGPLDAFCRALDDLNRRAADAARDLDAARPPVGPGSAAVEAERASTSGRDAL